MTDPHCSGCPINLRLEALGDKWSLIVVRDIMTDVVGRWPNLMPQQGVMLAPC
jgi:hypothetical protein